MLGNGFRRKRKTSNIDTLIGEKTKITGDVRFSGGLHVDGVIKGNVVTDAADESSLLSVGVKGSIEGDVEVSNVVLNGSIAGILRSSGHAELAPGSHVTGDIYYNLLQVTPHAEINGRLIHTPAGDVKKAVVAKAAPGKAVPGEAVGKAAPGEAAPGKTAPREAVGKAAPREAAGKAAPGEAAPGKTAPGEAAPGKAAPGEAVGKAAPGKTAPGKAAPGTENADARPGVAPPEKIAGK